MRAAIIGGSGVDATGLLEAPQRQAVETPYGEALIEVGTFEGDDVAVLRRHGPGHTVPPHRVNYRANVWALREIGARWVIATAAVGSLDPDLEPGTLVVIDGFLDFTRARGQTFHEGAGDGVVHVDVTAPYCAGLRRLLLEEGRSRDLSVHDGGVYVCTEGPRFESPAEIRAYHLMGGTVVGMTGLPEVVLARELGLHYATVASVTNLAAGLSVSPLTHEEVLEVQAANAHRLGALLEGAIAELSAAPRCDCAPAPVPVGGDRPAEAEAALEDRPGGRP